MWHLNLLGGLRLFNESALSTVAPQEITRFHTRKVGALLAYLALHPGEHSREKLMQLLWPGTDEKNSSNNLRVSLWALRRQLDALGLSSQEILFARRRGVQLREDAFVCDVHRFEHHWKASLSTTGTVRAHALQNAFTLYEGRLLASYLEVWSEPMAIALESLFERVAQELIQWHCQQGDLVQALALANQASHLVPEQGEFVFIAQQLTDAQRLLQTQSKSFSTKKQDKHPLFRAETAPITTKTLQVSSQVVPSAKEWQGAFPLYPTRFWGRKEELATLLDTTQGQESMQLITLIGPPAIGKTRLSVEAGRSALTTHAASRVYFVPLAAIDSPALVEDAIRDSLGLSASSTVAPLEQVVTTLRMECAQAKQLSEAGATTLHPKRVVLLLDNLEHLLPDAAFLVERLRLQVPDLLVWTTSRAPLRLPGEELIEVKGLPLPGEKDALAIVTASPSVQMFVQRARSANPAFTVTPSNVVALVKLCRRLEGWPLALELAAARANSFTPAQMLKHLQKGNEFLTHTSSPAPMVPECDRQSSLYAAIEWSYRLLSPGTADLLLTLAVFRGGGTTDQVQQVASSINAMPPLAELVGHSLITCSEKGGVLRYDLLEGVRQFAQEQLSETQWNSLRQKHAATFDQFVENAPTWTGKGVTGWFAQLDIERDNVRVVLEWAAEHDAGLLLRLSSRLWRYWESRGLITEGTYWLKTALSKVETVPNESDATAGQVKLQIAAWNGLARLCFMSSQFEEGLKASQRARDLACEYDDDSGLAYALLSLGIINLYQGRVQEALHALESSYAGFERHNDLSGASHALIYRGFAGIFGGAYHESLQTYQSAVAKARECEDHARLATALFFCGDALGTVGGRYLDALPYFKESYEVSRQIGDGIAEAYAMWGMCRVAIAQGQLDEAQAYYEQIDDFCRRVHYYWGQIFVLEAGALLAIARQNIEQAALLLGAAEAAREKQGLPLTASYYAEFHRQFKPLWTRLEISRLRALWHKGRLHSLSQALEVARGREVILDASLVIQHASDESAPPFGFPCDLKRALPALAESHFGTGCLALFQNDLDSAHSHLKMAQSLYNRLGDSHRARMVQQWLDKA